MSTYDSVNDDTHIHQNRRIALMVAKAISYVVYFYVVVVEVILLLGFLLLLLGANSSSGFVEWVYRSLERAMNPFRGIFEPVYLGTIGSSEVESVFATSVVFAMIVYGIVALVIGSLLDWLTSRVNRLDAEDREARRLRAYEQGPGAAQAVSAAATADPQTYGAQQAGGGQVATGQASGSAPPPPPPAV